MKTFVIANNSPISEAHIPAGRGDVTTTWYFLPDSALTNAGKPFFIPEFADNFVAIPSVAVKISRLGKSVDPRFASRYYSEIAPAIHFKAPELEKSLVAESLPADRARAFDRSLFIGEFMNAGDFKDRDIAFTVNGQKVYDLNLTAMPKGIETLISDISADNTLKMGDILIPTLPSSFPLSIGDVISIRLADTDLLTVRIR